MLRELAEALDVLTAETPLVLVLEDLQWSDHSTVEALAYVAQRRAPARLLVLGTYRPVEMALRAPPLRGILQELYGRGQAVDVRLELLPAEAVTAYVTERLGGPVAAPLAALILERTEGNALFLVTMVEHLVQQGWVVGARGSGRCGRGARRRWRVCPRGCGSCCCGASRRCRPRWGGCWRRPAWWARRLRWRPWRRQPGPGGGGRGGV